MAGYLIAEEGPLAGQVLHFEEGTEWVLGRDRDEVSIVLEDPMVSRRHVICRLTTEGYILENLSAVNPVTQNGKVITDPVLLQEGDILQIGSTFFRFSEKPLLGRQEPSQGIDSPLYVEGPQDLLSVNIEGSEDARWFLKVISGPNAGAEFGMHPASTYILGKDPNLCDIVFQDLSVSRQHARISVDENNRTFIEDLQSRNGVLINGEILKEKKQLSSQDLVSLGTTAFLVIDRDEVHETILAQAPVSFPKEELATAPSASLEEKRDWKEMKIPKRHLIAAGAFVLLLIGGFGAMMALFNTEPIVISTKHESEKITDIIKEFSDVQFSFNPSNGKLFLVGHVLTSVDKQELLYKIKNLPFVTAVDDNVVIDEYVWQNMNALLMTYPEWQGVSIHSSNPGKFILKGYLQTLEQAQALSDYLNINFPYLDRLDNQVVVETNLQTQVQSVLTEKGFSGVTFQLSNGELIFSGRVDHLQSHQFSAMIDKFKSLNGVRLVKNFVVFSTGDTSRVDLSGQYSVSGFSKRDETSAFVVINGKILGVGDVIDGMAITRILPNMVLLEKDGLKFKINYNLQ